MKDSHALVQTVFSGLSPLVIEVLADGADRAAHEPALRLEMSISLAGALVVTEDFTQAAAVRM